MWIDFGLVRFKAYLLSNPSGVWTDGKVRMRFCLFSVFFFVRLSVSDSSEALYAKPAIP